MAEPTKDHADDLLLGPRMAEIGGGDSYRSRRATFRAQGDLYAMETPNFYKKGVNSESSSKTHVRIENFVSREKESHERLGVSREAIRRRRLASVPFDDRVDPRLGANGTHDGLGRYSHSSRARFGNPNPGEDDRDRLSAFRRISLSKHEDEGGPSNKNQYNIDGVDHLSRDPVQFLRHLDELRDRISRSCEIAKPREKTLVGGVSLYSSRSGVVKMNTRDKMPNSPSPLYDNHGHEEQQQLEKAYCQVRSRNHDHLHKQFAVDSLTSYHHDDYHHSACSCTDCLSKHRPLAERVTLHSIANHSQRRSYLAPSHGLHSAGLQMLRKQEHKERGTRAAVSKDENKRLCQSFAGAAPFITCSSCFELLWLSQVNQFMSKKLCKIRCGSCSEVFSIELIGNRLAISSRSSATSTAEANSSSHAKENEHPQAKVYISTTTGASNPQEFGGPCESIQSTDNGNFSPLTSSHELMKRENVFNLSEVDKSKGISTSASKSDDDMENPGSTICEAPTPDTTEHPCDAEVITYIADSVTQENLICPSSSQVIGSSGNESPSRGYVQETTVSNINKVQQNSANDEVVTEIDLSVPDFSSSNVSQEYQEIEEDQNQAGIGKSDNSLVSEDSLKVSHQFKPSIRDQMPKVFINGHPIPDQLVRKAEQKAGHIFPGQYWYDRTAGFWGVMGRPCLGVIPPFIEEFNHPMSKNCGGGNTGVYVNGRELHKKDFNLLVSRGLPSTAGRSYLLEFSGDVSDEISGEKLGNIGKLGPTVEKMRRGFGMKVPM